MTTSSITSNNSFPRFSIETKLAEAQSFLAQYDWSHLPIVDSTQKWIGNIYTEDILEQDPESCIEDILYDLEHFYVAEEKHSFQYFDIFAQYNCNVLPLLDEQGCIVKIISRDSLWNEWSTIEFVSSKGISFLIEKEEEQYSFSQISQIVEQNNAHLFGIVVLSRINNRTQLLVKTNGTNSATILSDLRRYGYAILSEHIEDTYNVDLQEKSAYLNKYLNI
ncbi:MAG: CBS domain-containing protein [Flavobacteriaceae bacterium]|jgi:Mg/Co/Ni transporter MgtE|nr:CBS domain-containing protein [Flavobacteriaceae bacterium]